MARLPTAADLGARPTPQAYQGRPSTVPNAGGVAQAAGQLGETVVSIGQKFLQGQEAQEAAGKRSEWLITKTRLDDEFSRDTDFGTQEARYSAALSKARQDISSKFKFKDARADFDAQANLDYERGLVSARERIFKGRASQSVADHNAMSETNLQTALAAPDLNDSVALLNSVKTNLRALREQGYITPEQETKQSQDIVQRFGVEKMQLLPAAEQVRLLQPYHGKNAPQDSLAGLIPIETRRKLLEQAETDVRIGEAKAEVERRRVQAEVEQAEKEREDTVSATIEQGIPVPTADIQTAVRTAEARGDTSKAVGLRAKAYANAALAVMQDATVPQVNTRLAEIEGWENWRSSPDLVMEHNALSTLRSDMQSKPAAYAPVDFADTRSVSARAQAAEADARTRGLAVPDYLGRDDLNNIKDTYAQGPAGRANAAAMVSRLGGRRAMIAARQVAPDDAVFWHSAGLNNDTRQLALEGRDVMAANPAISQKDSAERQWNTRIGGALRDMPADYAFAIRQTAMAITASRLAREGVIKPSIREYEDTFRESLNAAMGGQGNAGGLGKWKGSTVLLPTGMTQSDFDLRLTRLGGNLNAFYGNGLRITPEDLRGNFTPVSAGDGLYHFYDSAGRPAMAKNGTPSLLNVRTINTALPPRSANAPVLKPNETLDMDAAFKRQQARRGK